MPVACGYIALASSNILAAPYIAVVLIFFVWKISAMSKRQQNIEKTLKTEVQELRALIENHLKAQEHPADEAV